MLFLTRHVGETLAKFSAPLIVGAGTVGTGVYVWLTDGFQTKQKALDLSSQKLSNITQENEALAKEIKNKKQKKIESKERSEQLSQTLHLLKMRAILDYMTQQYSENIEKFKTAKETLISNIDKNEALKTEITKLETEIKNNLTELKAELQKIKNDMPDFYTGVLKTREYKNFASINIIQSKVKTKTNGQTVFQIDKDGSEIEFTVKKTDELFKLETAIEAMKKSGIKLTLKTENLNKWNGDFYITRSRRCWDCKLQVKSGKKTSMTLSKIEAEQKLNIKTIFDEKNTDMYHNAVKLLEVMSRIQAIKFDQIENQSTVFEATANNSTNFGTTPLEITHKAWTSNNESNKWTIDLHSFGSKEDFVKYWIMKTIELTISKKVDLSALLDPIHKKESYSSAN